MVKKYLDDRGVAYEEHNVENEPQYIDYLKNQGFKAVPVIEGPDHQAFYGFRPKELAALAG
jgi:glutaredoxin-like protein NrdH